MGDGSSLSGDDRAGRIKKYLVVAVIALLLCCILPPLLIYYIGGLDNTHPDGQSMNPKEKHQFQIVNNVYHVVLGFCSTLGSVVLLPLFALLIVVVIDDSDASIKPVEVVEDTNNSQIPAVIVTIDNPTTEADQGGGEPSSNCGEVAGFCAVGLCLLCLAVSIPLIAYYRPGGVQDLRNKVHRDDHQYASYDDLKQLQQANNQFYAFVGVGAVILMILATYIYSGWYVGILGNRRRTTTTRTRTLPLTTQDACNHS